MVLSVLFTPEVAKVTIPKSEVISLSFIESKSTFFSYEMHSPAINNCLSSQEQFPLAVGWLPPSHKTH